MSLLRRIEKSQRPPEQAKGSTSRLRELQPRVRPTPAQDAHADIRARVQDRLIAEYGSEMDMSKPDEVRTIIEGLFDRLLEEDGTFMGPTDRARVLESIVADILGFGPIQPFLNDESVTEVMVNGANQVYVERNGKLERTRVRFQDDDHVMQIIDRIVQPLGRRIDESSPYVHARLPDGSRVNAIIPPLCLNGPTITIRKFFVTPLSIEDLIELGTVTAEAIEFLRACVISKINMIVSGGTGSGKTTFLNVLSSFIPGDERIVTIENAAELRLRQQHVVTLEARPPNIEGSGEVTIRDLVINSLRMRPDRIIVGECRSGEALDMLQAMNTGHEGSLTTAHSNSPRDTLARIETMFLMSGMEMPVRAIREQIASAIDLIVHLERFRDGSRKIVAITEVQGMEGDIIVMQDLFRFEQVGMEEGKIIGRLKPTGIRPRFMDQIEAAGIRLSPSTFGLGDRLRY